MIVGRPNHSATAPESPGPLLLARTTCEPLLTRAPLLRVPMDTSSCHQEFAQASQPDDGLSSRMLRRRQRILRNLSVGSRQCSIASSGYSSGSTFGSRCSLTRVRITRHCGGPRELRPFATSLDIQHPPVPPDDTISLHAHSGDRFAPHQI